MYLDANITIDYEERPGSPMVNANWSNFTATRILRCAWEDRHTLAKELIGYLKNPSVRYLPHQYEAELSNETIVGLYALNVRIEPFPREGLNQTTGSYKYAKLTVDYGVPEYDLDNLPFTPFTNTVLVSESLEPAAEFGTMTHKNLYWEDNTAIESTEVPGYLMPSADWVYTIHQLDAIPDAYFTHIGSVNNATVFSRQLNRSFATGCLLCRSPILSREISSLGNGLWKCSFRFSYRNNGTFASPKGWNYFPQLSKTGASVTWSRLCYDDSSSIKLVYPESDFSSIVI